MDIIVLTKRVPVTQEEELKVAQDGKSVDLSRVPFRMNDWDNYAVEEAVRICEKQGGAITGVSIGDMESDEVLRRAIAMGAKDGCLVETQGIIQDPFTRAVLIKNFIEKEGIPFNVIFGGVQAEDDQFGVTCGILAAMLKLPFASMVIGIDEIQGDKIILRRELEGGIQERIGIRTPCVLSIQSGINEPRYVSIMGIRKASKVERRYFKAEKYLEDGAGALIDVIRWFYPPKKEGAVMLQGEIEDTCKQLIGILKEKGVLQ
ncbi:MAG: electron transfer flavoprotein subunit beta/FixA family protein [Syntrophorhabdaceae bacterium]|jgi:electron transfer flavoprotein beta subunit|nr:electron transfer flavoprotein subunit beta/FixA family protein [Syntrophorhabdales bacterium]MBP9561231.1 electron transfer flavoprotein subunit beta/FixA family protein [Syntrophorhabdaceae bacterium]